MNRDLAPGLLHLHSGKVRETYGIEGHPGLLLMVASDRISTHNVTHLSEIPQKGEYLTALTVYWARTALAGIKTHLVAAGKEIYDFLPASAELRAGLHRRGVIVRKQEVLPYEFIWRNYLMGSLWSAYRKGEDPYGLNLPAGMALMQPFPEPVFTPTEKSEKDDPVSPTEVIRECRRAAWRTRDAFALIAGNLHARGITLIDAKFEASRRMLVDEFGTGDCMRMAYTRDITPGVEPPWLDKEVARQLAMEKWGIGPRIPIEFSPSEAKRIAARYHEAFEAITAMPLASFQAEYLD